VHLYIQVQHFLYACCLSFQGKAVGSWTTLKMKAANSSEMLVSIHQSKLHHIPRYWNFHMDNRWHLGTTPEHATDCHSMCATSTDWQGRQNNIDG